MYMAVSQCHLVSKVISQLSIVCAQLKAVIQELQISLLRRLPLLPPLRLLQLSFCSLHYDKLMDPSNNLVHQVAYKAPLWDVHHNECKPIHYFRYLVSVMRLLPHEAPNKQNCQHVEVNKRVHDVVYPASVRLAEGMDHQEEDNFCSVDEVLPFQSNCEAEGNSDGDSVEEE